MNSMAHCRGVCIEFNLFETNATDAESIYVQRWSTRVNTVILLCFMSTLIVYNGLHVDTRLIEVQKPSFDSYLKLKQTHVDINCLCSKVSCSFSSFVKLMPIYDSICSSDFVSKTWIDILVDNMTTVRYPGISETRRALNFKFYE